MSPAPRAGWQRKCTLEQFIFNVATIFLDPKQYFFFKIFVLCNRSSDLKQSIVRNNVYNQHKLFNYLRYGTMEQRDLDQLDSGKQTQESKTVDEALGYLFEKGFIVRYTKYESAGIEYRTPLTFKPYQFIKNFHQSFVELFEKLEEQRLQREQQKGNRFVCTSASCRDRHYTEEQELQILNQNKYQALHQIVCPCCHGDKCIKKFEPNARDRTFDQAYELIEELKTQSTYLLNMSDPAKGGDEEYLDRELRAMRSEYNEKINKQQEVARAQEVHVDRRRIFRNKRLMSLGDSEADKKQRLEMAEHGVNIDSVFERRRGPVYKAPRYYQSGMIGNQKPEWLDQVYEKAERILHME